MKELKKKVLWNFVTCDQTFCTVTQLHYIRKLE